MPHFQSSSPAKAGDPVRPGLSAVSDRLWNTGLPGPVYAFGFDAAHTCRARRSISEGGKPGNDSGDHARQRFRHCERSEAIQSFFRGPGLLRR
jgi:hypothetical protein